LNESGAFGRRFFAGYPKGRDRIGPCAKGVGRAKQQTKGGQLSWLEHLVYTEMCGTKKTQ
jgi:hypothetical protein